MALLGMPSLSTWSGNLRLNGEIQSPSNTLVIITNHREKRRSKIIITSRRKPAQLFWHDPRLTFIPLDFLKHVDELIEAMTPLCNDVTHAFFASYVHDADFSKLAGYNVPLFTNFLVALDAVATNTLQRICLHTGGKVIHSLDFELWWWVNRTLALRRPSWATGSATSWRDAAVRRSRGKLLLPTRGLLDQPGCKTQLGLERHKTRCHYWVYPSRSAAMFMSSRVEKARNTSWHPS